MSKSGRKPDDDLRALQCMALKIGHGEASSERHAASECAHLAPRRPGTKPESITRRLRKKFSRARAQLQRWAHEEIEAQDGPAPRKGALFKDPIWSLSSQPQPPRRTAARDVGALSSKLEPQPRAKKRTVTEADLRKVIDGE